jgi:UDP-N-acetylglucosamine 2-epimerase (non-hydrolysing)
MLCCSSQNHRAVWRPPFDLLTTMPELIFVVGARPNFMKVAPVLREFQARNVGVACKLVHTGQHYSEQMSDVFLSQLGMPEPDANLCVGSGTHGQQTARVLEAFENYLLNSATHPLGVIVVGDVNSTIACALAATKLGIPVAHLEAGLRSYDRQMPEEVNRVATDAISDLLLVSEPHGEENLRREGVAAERIAYVGNVMIDTLVHQLNAARALDMPERLGLNERQYAVITLHRPSNVDDDQRLSALSSFVIRLSARLPVVFPLHPRCEARLSVGGHLQQLRQTPAVHLMGPLGYRENLSLLAAAKIVLTDSGGIQEETSYLDVPCITLRTTTERPITITHGTNTLVGMDLEQATAVVEDCLDGTRKRCLTIPGWDGCAAGRVVDALVERWASN